MFGILGGRRTQYVGVYSYPKSGSTWFRQILSCAFQFEKSKHANICPDIDHVESLDLPVDTGIGPIQFFKSHSKKIQKTYNDTPIRYRSVVHIIRNPFDVFLSYMNYISRNMKGLADLGFENVENAQESGLLESYFHAFVVFGTIRPKFVRAGSYFDSNLHFLEKSKKSSYPVFLLRYENFLADPFAHLEPFFSSLRVEKSQLISAIESVDRSGKQDGKFFWRRGTGNFRDFITEDMVALMKKYREREVTALGYGDLLETVARPARLVVPQSK